MGFMNRSCACVISARSPPQSSEETHSSPRYWRHYPGFAALRPKGNGNPTRLANRRKRLVLSNFGTGRNISKFFEFRKGVESLLAEEAGDSTRFFNLGPFGYAAKFRPICFADNGRGRYGSLVPLYSMKPTVRARHWNPDT